MTPELASDLIEQERAAFPRAVELARHLSIAVRIETELLRAMRLKVMPHVEAGVEADFYFSTLVQARDVNAVALIPEVRTRLREELAEHKDELEIARNVIEAAHRDMDAVVLLEEMVAYYSLRADWRGFQQMQSRLGTIVKELAKADVDPDLLRWSANALPRLPQRAQTSAAGRALGYALSEHIARETGDKTDTGPIVVRTPAAPVTFGFTMHSDGAQLVNPVPAGWHVIEMPGPFPLSVELGWPVAGGWHSVQVELDEAADFTTLVDVPVGLVRLRGINGDEYRLRPRGPYADLQPLLFCLHDGSDTRLEDVDAEVQDLDWQSEWVWQKTVPDHPAAADLAQRDFAACLLSFADAASLSKYLGDLQERGSGAPYLIAPLDTAVDNNRPLLLQVGEHIARLQPERFDPILKIDESAPKLARRTRLVRALEQARQDLDAADPRVETHNRELLRGALLAGERAAIDAWLSEPVKTEKPPELGDPTQAMVMIQWERWFPKGAASPLHFNSYRSGQARLTRLVGNGGTLWVVTSRKMPDGRLQYQLAYRLRNAQTVAASQGGKRENKEQRVQAQTPGDVTQFPLHDATELLLNLKFTSGKPLKKPGDIGRRLRSIPQLSVADVERLEAFVRRLAKPAAANEAVLRGLIAGDSPQGHAGTVRGIAVSDDGTLALTAGNSSSDRAVKLWDLDGLRLLHTFDDQAAEGGLTPMAIAPDGSIAVCGNRDALHVWDLKSGERLRKLSGTSGEDFTAVGFAGPRQALAGSRSDVALFDLDTGTRTTVATVDEPVVAVAHSHGRVLCLLTTDLRVIDLETGALLHQVSASNVESALHFQRVPLYVADDDNLAFYGSPLRGLRLTDNSPAPVFDQERFADAAVSGRVVRALGADAFQITSGYRDPVTLELSIAPDQGSCVALSGNGNRLVIADYEHNLRVYDLPALRANQREPTDDVDDEASQAKHSGDELEIELLPARHGQSVMISYGDPELPRRVLVDCGPRGTALVRRLRQLPHAQRRLELVVLTHLDTDATGGALKVFGDAKLDVQIGDVWFNGWQHVRPDTLGAVGVEMIGGRLRDAGLPWNEAFDGRAVVLSKEGAHEIALPGGMRITLLSPRSEELDALSHWWSEKRRRQADSGVAGDMNIDAELSERESVEERSPPRVSVPTPEDVYALAAETFRGDRSVANGSSIAFLAQFAGLTLLIGADARTDVLIEGIRRVLAEGTVERLSLDGLFVPHGGSKRNLNMELLSLVDCSRFIFSTNGARFRHPDPQTIARILVHGQSVQSSPTLYFNYRSDETRIWDDRELQNHFNYDAVFPDDDKAGLRLQLSSSR